MWRLLPALLMTVVVLACGETPLEPPIAPDLHAKLTAPPDLSGILPQLERRVFIHYRRGFARPEGRGKPKTETASQCFSLLAKGAKWRVTEPYRTATAVGTLPVATWDAVHDIFGAPETAAIPLFDGELDGLNTAQLGFYPNDNVIAVTVVWGIFIGPPRGRELVEWDILLNDHFAFGDAAAGGNPAPMDTEGILAHELGHAGGLGHPPDDCTEETMYAFASAGETKKRTLEAGDIAGIQELYQ